MLARSFKRVAFTIEAEDGEIAYKKWEANGRRLMRTAVTLVAGVAVIGSLVVVPPGHRGAIYKADGIDVAERNEGYSLMVPLFHNANMVNVREQLYSNEEVYGQTADVLEVTMQVGVNYRINPEKAADIFREVGHEYETAIIENAVLDIGKAVIGQFDAGEVPVKRGEITSKMRDGLAARLAPVGIDVTFVALRDIILPESFVEAVELKEVAQEKQEESLRLVEVAKNEADAVKKRADGDAYAITALAAAREDEQTRLGLSPTEYVWFTKWDGILPSTLLGGGDFIVNLPN